MYSEIRGPSAQAKKLRVIQLGSYPAPNRGARTNLLTIHERLQARGHESSVIDLTPYHRVKQAGVHYPRSLTELGRLLLEFPADVVHLHIGSAFTARKLALAALLNKLPEAKTMCTLHLGGHFYPKKGLRAWRWGATGMILRQFDRLIAINPEIAGFFERLGVEARRVHLITPFPRLRVSDGLTLPDEIEDFCRRHTPLIASVGAFEPGADLASQFDILSRVRERYPCAGLIAMGGGRLYLELMYQRALHRDGNHIALTGALSREATSELIHRANVFLRTEDNDGDSFSIREALKAGTPIVATNNGRRPAAALLADIGDTDAAALQVLRSLQIPRPRGEDTPPALSDGVDDVIRLYKQIAAKPAEEARLAAAYEWQTIGWGL
jgi:glycosyltransferase involved in cell wall biosynthesis